MGPALAIIFIVTSWFAILALGTAPLAIRDIHSPLPNGQKRGTSILPTIPLLPGMAIIWYFMVAEGTRALIIWTHISLLVFSLIAAAGCHSYAQRLRMRSSSGQREPNQEKK